MKDANEGVYEDCFNNIKLLVGMMQIWFIYPAIIIIFHLKIICFLFLFIFFLLYLIIYLFIDAWTYSARRDSFW